MNAPHAAIDSATLGCRELGFAALGALLQATPDEDAPEARFLRQAWLRCGGASWPQQVAQTLALPPPEDAALLRVAALLRLAPVEVLAVALAAGVEHDPLIGRLFGWLQAPAGQARPSLALLARALAPLHPGGSNDAQAEAETLYALAFGAAQRAGLLLLDGDDRPLCERGLRVHPSHRRRAGRHRRRLAGRNGATVDGYQRPRRSGARHLGRAAACRRRRRLADPQRQPGRGASGRRRAGCASADAAGLVRQRAAARCRPVAGADAACAGVRAAQRARRSTERAGAAPPSRPGAGAGRSGRRRAPRRWRARRMARAARAAGHAADAVARCPGRQPRRRAGGAALPCGTGTGGRTRAPGPAAVRGPGRRSARHDAA